MRSDGQNAVRAGSVGLPVAPWERVFALTISATATRVGPIASDVFLVSLRVFGAPRCYWKAGLVTVDAVADLADSVAIVESDSWVDIPVNGGRRYISVIGDGAATGQLVERSRDPWLGA